MKKLGAPEFPFEKSPGLPVVFLSFGLPIANAAFFKTYYLLFFVV